MSFVTNFKVTKGYARPVHTRVTGKTEKTAIKHLAGGNYEATVKDLIGNEEGKRALVAIAGREIFEREIGTITSYKSLTDLHAHEIAQKCRNFSWESLWRNIQTSAPMLSSLLQQLTPSQKGETLTPAYCMITAMLAKARNRRVCFLQEAVSLILHAGHTSTA